MDSCEPLNIPRFRMKSSYYYHRMKYFTVVYTTKNRTTTISIEPPNEKNYNIPSNKIMPPNKRERKRYFNALANSRKHIFPPIFFDKLNK